MFPLRFGGHGSVVGVRSSGPDGGTGGFITAPPAHLKPSSTQLQAKGRFLETADVGPHLRGRWAELYWPDDGHWYLIEIQNVSSAGLTAHIMYYTRDTEELQLGDIIRDRHMHLIHTK